MTISNHTLVKIAAFGGLATVTMGLIARSKINDNVKQMPFYKDALKTLRANRGAIHLLGEPIKDSSIDVGDTFNNYTKDHNAHYMVPIRGSKQKGILYFWAIKKSDDSWTVNRIELGLNNEPNRRLLIKNVD